MECPLSKFRPVSRDPLSKVAAYLRGEQRSERTGVIASGAKRFPWLKAYSDRDCRWDGHACPSSSIDKLEACPPLTSSTITLRNLDPRDVAPRATDPAEWVEHRERCHRRA